MSHQSAMDQNVKMYSDEASMANDSNGESILQVVTPQAVEESEMGLLPKLRHSCLHRFSVTEGFS